MINTAEKRFAMLGFGRAGFSLPVADGSFEAFDRMHLLGGYLPVSIVTVTGWYSIGHAWFTPGSIAGETFQPGSLSGVWFAAGSVSGAAFEPGSIAAAWFTPGSINGEAI